MRYKQMFVGVMVSALTLAGQGQSNKAEILLGTGLHQEEVENNCKEAIKTYQKAIQEKSAPRNIAARAQLHIGACQEKLGQSEARKTYKEVSRQYSEQTDVVADADRRLAALGFTHTKAPQVPAQYLGVWRGTIDQGDGKPYLGVISMTGGGIGSLVGSVAYPATCSGDLTLRAVSANSIELSERLTYEANLCANDGLITLTMRQNGTLDFLWHHAAFPGTATARLSKTLSDAEAPVQLAWFDRTGKELSSVGAAGSYRGLDLSLDGKRLAIHRHDGNGGDIWIIESSGGTMSRLTTDADGQQDNASPIWSPDGNRIVFGSHRNGKWGLYMKRADGVGKEELLVESDLPKMPMSWSPDGKSIVYWVRDPKTGSDEWVVPITGDRKPVPLLQTPFNENHAQISPDGKWIAYFGNEDGQGVYIRPFPSGAGRWKVSSDGGLFPRWRADGKELYFLSGIPNGKLMAVDIQVVGSSLQPGIPHALFDSGYTNFTHGLNYHTYAVSPDGQRFLIPRPVNIASISQ